MGGLLVSTYRGREDECGSEVWYVLSEIGVDGDIERLPLPGLVLVRFEADPVEVVEKIRRMAEERPWDFRYMLKVTPLQVIIDADLEKLGDAVEALASKIPPNATFRVTLHRRSSPLERGDIIRVAASKVSAKVDLENPEYLVVIEIVGKMMGVSVLKPSQIVSIPKIKERKLREISGG